MSVTTRTDTRVFPEEQDSDSRVGKSVALVGPVVGERVYCPVGVMVGLLVGRGVAWADVGDVEGKFVGRGVTWVEVGDAEGKFVGRVVAWIDVGDAEGKFIDDDVGCEVFSLFEQKSGFDIFKELLQIVFLIQVAWHDNRTIYVEVPMDVIKDEIWYKVIVTYFIRYSCVYTRVSFWCTT